MSRRLGFRSRCSSTKTGHKVSKSIGRGVTAEQWTRYAPIEVLKYFLLLNPRRARKLFLDAIPQYVDDYLDALRAWAAAPELRAAQLAAGAGAAERERRAASTRSSAS